MSVSCRILFTVGMTLVFGGVALAAPLEELGEEGIVQCTIDFDSVCPDTAQVCRTKARGGAGCVVDGLPFCYDSGSFSYRVNAGEHAQFKLRGAVDEIEVFFAQGAAGTGGDMTFFDENGLQVGSPITTNGICADLMPATQTVTFATPVKLIRVRAIDTAVYVDSLTLTRN